MLSSGCVLTVARCQLTGSYLPPPYWCFVHPNIVLFMITISLHTPVPYPSPRNVGQIRYVWLRGRESPKSVRLDVCLKNTQGLGVILSVSDIGKDFWWKNPFVDATSLAVIWKPWLTTAYLQLVQNVHVHVKTCGFFPTTQCSLDSKLDQRLQLSPHYMNIKTIVYDA